MTSFEPFKKAPAAAQPTPGSTSRKSKVILFSAWTTTRFTCEILSAKNTTRDVCSRGQQQRPPARTKKEENVGVTDHGPPRSQHGRLWFPEIQNQQSRRILSTSHKPRDAEDFPLCSIGQRARPSPAGSCRLSGEHPTPTPTERPFPHLATPHARDGMAYEYLLVNMSKGWVLGLQDGQPGLFSARLERRLLGVKHDLNDLGQLNEALKAYVRTFNTTEPAFDCHERRKRKELGPRVIHWTAVPVAPCAVLPNLSRDLLANIISHISADDAFLGVQAAAALAMSCQQLYATVRPLLVSAMDATSRWAGDNIFIIRPRTTPADMPQNVMDWCSSDKPIILIEDVHWRIRETMGLLSRMRGLLGHKQVLCAPEDMLTYVRAFLVHGEARRRHGSSFLPGTSNISTKALGSIWLGLASESPRERLGGAEQERFLYNATTGHFVRQSLFEQNFASRALPHTRASRIELGDTLALRIISPPIHSKSWAGHLFIFTGDKRQVAHGKDVSQAFIDDLVTWRAHDMKSGTSDSPAKDSIVEPRAGGELIDNPEVEDGADQQVPSVATDGSLPATSKCAKTLVQPLLAPFVLSSTRVVF
ncbi:hypothetical protein AURDEDRAFT_125881 [Auricularia subglabra TFB-10046 SS5]|nr:hypothetical protein AURDEDRAFT_125881 [Auricularia subglabra TFB-10046 SS5]